MPKELNHTFIPQEIREGRNAYARGIINEETKAAHSKYNMLLRQLNPNCKENQRLATQRFREKKLKEDPLYIRRISYFDNFPNAKEEDFINCITKTNCEGCSCVLTDKKGKKVKDSDRCQDHCHNTGKLRKVLCMRCNLIMGMIRDIEHAESILKLTKEYNT